MDKLRFIFDTQWRYLKYTLFIMMMLLLYCKLYKMHINSYLFILFRFLTTAATRRTWCWSATRACSRWSRASWRRVWLVCTDCINCPRTAICMCQPWMSMTLWPRPSSITCIAAGSPSWMREYTLAWYITRTLVKMSRKIHNYIKLNINWLLLEEKHTVVGINGIIPRTYFN